MFSVVTQIERGFKFERWYRAHYLLIRQQPGKEIPALLQTFNMLFCTSPQASSRRRA